MDDDKDRRRRFGAALERALAGKTRGWLGAEVGARLGLPSPVTQSAVAQWINGDTEPSMDKVFAIEYVLRCPPGKLSRLLGYLPVNAKPVQSVPDAIDLDPQLSPGVRRILRAAYSEAVEVEVG